MGVQRCEVGVRRITLADDEPAAVSDVLAIALILTVNHTGDIRQSALLIGDGNATEDAVVAAADMF